MFPDWLAISSKVAFARRDGLPVVALESSLITHGLPRPENIETAIAAEIAVRDAGAVPATIAVRSGIPCVGLEPEQLRELAQTDDVVKASRRDLGAVMALKRTAGTTVSATMVLARAARIRVFATGGIGGVHRPSSTRADKSEPLDVSADLMELARTPMLVVCAGAKSILDIPQTLELLETLGIPVIGMRTDEFPRFFTRGGGGPVSVRVESPREAADVFRAHVVADGGGALLVQPLDEELAIPEDELESAMIQAESDARERGIIGSKLTPFLLKRLSELTGGRTLAANRALIENNAQLAAETAKAMGRVFEFGK